MLAQLEPDLPARSQHNLQANVARDGGTVFAVQHGSLIMHGTTPTRDHPARSLADTQDGAAHE